MEPKQKEDLKAKEDLQLMKFKIKKERTNVMIKTLTIAAFQIALCLFLFQTIRRDIDEGCKIKIPGIKLAFARFITGIIMHINMNKELQEGMNKMKFALNHKWKFSAWYLGFLSGFLQFNITLLVTLINYFVIVFEPDILGIVKDFLAIKVIAELDEFFFIEHTKNEISKKLVIDETIQDILTIETTTSIDAKPGVHADHVYKN